jgi:hypothetical protein
MNEPLKPISCSDLAKAGYPENYTILQIGLQAIGWNYNITKDEWYPPIQLPLDQRIARCANRLLDAIKEPK